MAFSLTHLVVLFLPPGAGYPIVAAALIVYPMAGVPGYACPGWGLPMGGYISVVRAIGHPFLAHPYVGWRGPGRSFHHHGGRYRTHIDIYLRRSE